MDLCWGKSSANSNDFSGVNQPIQPDPCAGNIWKLERSWHELTKQQKSPNELNENHLTAPALGARVRAGDGFCGTQFPTSTAWSLCFLTTIDFRGDRASAKSWSSKTSLHDLAQHCCFTNLHNKFLVEKPLACNFSFCSDLSLGYRSGLVIHSPVLLLAVLFCLCDSGIPLKF